MHFDRIIYFGSSHYIVMIKIYETMYLEREKILKSLVLLFLWVKGVVCPPLWYTLILWVWGLSYLLIVTPFGWLMALYLTWSYHSYCVYLWYDDFYFMVFIFGPLVHYPKQCWKTWPRQKVGEGPEYNFSATSAKKLRKVGKH